MKNRSNLISQIMKCRGLLYAAVRYIGRWTQKKNSWKTRDFFPAHLQCWGIINMIRCFLVTSCRNLSNHPKKAIECFCHPKILPSAPFQTVLQLFQGSHPRFGFFCTFFFEDIGEVWGDRVCLVLSPRLKCSSLIIAHGSSNSWTQLILPPEHPE